MRVVHRYVVEEAGTPFEVPGTVVLLAPKDTGTTLLLNVWVERNVPDVGERTTLVLVATGVPMPDDFKHVASAAMGDTYWHLYEVPS